MGLRWRSSYARFVMATFAHSIQEYLLQQNKSPAFQMVFSNQSLQQSNHFCWMTSWKNEHDGVMPVVLNHMMTTHWKMLIVPNLICSSDYKYMRNNRTVEDEHLNEWNISHLLVNPSLIAPANNFHVQECKHAHKCWGPSQANKGHQDSSMDGEFTSMVQPQIDRKLSVPRRDPNRVCRSIPTEPALFLHKLGSIGT
jgi:hypothetical protein